MIYGNSRDRNMSRLIRYPQGCPAIPAIGSGENLQQSVYVGDVAQAVADSLSSHLTAGRSYNIPAEEVLSFNQVIDTITNTTPSVGIRARAKYWSRRWRIWMFRKRRSKIATS